MAHILAVYAHCADAACEASGTLALHAERGDRVTIVLLTDGERHHNDLLYKEKDKAQKDPDVWQYCLFVQALHHNVVLDPTSF